jgi:hypothetical protein
MGERSSQIEQHIQEQRAELGDNIAQLQRKVKGTFDWRVQFEHRPMTLIGIALGGGLLLSSLFGGRSHSKRSRKFSDQTRKAPRGDIRLAEPQNGTATAQIEHKISDGWRDVKVALAGVAGAKFGTIVDSFLPGFSEEYDKARKSGERPQSKQSV